MKTIDINEIYTLFEEIRELVKAGNRNNTGNQPEVEQPDLSAIGELSCKLDEAIGEIRKPARMEHRHIFSIDSNKVFIGVIGMGIMCLFFLFTLFSQQKEIATYKDTDLKYRYIQLQGEITPAGLINLDSIFLNRRDSVKIIRNQVEQYEKAVIEKTKRLERARLKEQEAERLRQEANSSTYEFGVIK